MDFPPKYPVGPLERNTAQYLINQWIVVGEPAMSENYSARRI